MDRLRHQPIFIGMALLAVGCALAAASGCTLMATAMYVIQGSNTSADFGGLKGKRVVVVCRPITSLHFRDTSVSRMTLWSPGRYGGLPSVAMRRRPSSSAARDVVMPS